MNELTRLRERADELLDTGPSPTPPQDSVEHEFQVYRIELEMQNEALRQSQSDLEASRDRYVDLYEFAPVGYLTLGDTGQIENINFAGAEFLGEPRTKLMHRLFACFITSADTDRWHLHFASVLKREGTLTSEVSLLRGDGVRIDVRVDSRRLVKDGQPHSVQIALTDITARKQAEVLLREGALQSAIFNSANFSSIATDARGVIQIFNVGAERMLGYTAAEVMNKITPANISDPQEVIARAQALSAELGTPITPGFEALVFKASRGIEDIYELTYIRKDGSRFPAVVSVTALRDAQDAIIGYLLIGTDNTARKQVDAEQKKLDQRLRDQQFYTRSLIESNIDAIMTTDPAGIITDVNQQMVALTGCAREELINTPFKNYFNDPERAEAGIKQVLEEKKVSDYELTAHAKDGRETVVSYNAATFYNAEGLLQGVFAAARDVTEYKRLNQVLQDKNTELESARFAADAANLAKSRFLATMSHEIRTPMNGILGMAQMLLTPNLKDAERQDYVRTVISSGQILLTLLNDILDLSKVEAGKLSQESIAFESAQIMHETRFLFAETASRKGLNIETDWTGPAGQRYLGDPHRLRQMLSNLLGNAIKFTEKGRIRIEASEIERDGETALLEFAVSDTGIGIPPDKQSLLFLPFSQIDSSTTRQYGGTGLGLSIVRAMAGLMGGEVGVESQEGKGARFWFRIRAGLVAADQDSRVWPATGAARSPQRLPQFSGRVLAVEDGATNRKVLRALLEKVGLTVGFAEHGQEGVDAVTGGDAADLILMDVQMPVLDGYAATERIRQWEKDSGRERRTIIALTADAFEKDRNHCLAVGMDDFIAKPITSLDALIGVLSKWLPMEPPETAPAPAAKQVDVPRVLVLLRELEPLLAQKKFGAIGKFRDLQEAVAGTEVFEELAGMKPLLDEFQFNPVLERLQQMVLIHGWEETP